MRILLVNKFHWLKGGSETYHFELAKMLKNHGHEVAFFSTYNENNIKTGEKEYFTPQFDGNSKNITKAVKAIYSRENKKIMDKALEDFKPDIVHINLFQRHLTYSIIEAIKEKNIPIVFTAHDLQAVCPASAMLCNGVICEKCLKASKFNCMKNKCVKNSFLKSTLSSIEGTIYKNKEVYNKIDLIITPSNFVENQMRLDGISTKIKTVHNFVDIENFNSYEIDDKEYAFFFGRLSEEKGIVNLLKAFSNQEKGKLYIAGDGPEKEIILKYINDNKMNDRVRLLGYLSQDEIKKYISESSMVVTPSICYDNCPYSVLESFAIGKPVIGSKIGGIPELIEDGINGYLFEYNDLSKLTFLIEKMFSDKELRRKMGKEARKIAEEKYSIVSYYNTLIKLYEELVGE